MKNIVLILLLLPILGISQTIHTDSIQASDISGSDTTIFLRFKAELASTITFDYTNFNAKDAVLDFGYADNLDTYQRASSDFPATMDSTAHTRTVNGVTRVTIRVIKDKWNSKYIAWTWTPNSVSSGTLIWRYTR